MKRINYHLPKILLSGILLLAALTVLAQNNDIPDPMKPPRLVNDYANFFSQTEQYQLEQKLLDYERSTSTQIAVLTVKSLDGYEPNDFATRVLEKWGIGQKGKDNGILILIKPKTADERGEVYIATGYGVEASVTDAQAQRIVDIDILPAFRNGEYYQGIDKAINTLTSIMKGEFTADQYIAQHRGNSGKKTSGLAVFIIIIIIVLILRGISGGNKHISSRGGLPWWLLLTMLGSGGSRGSFGDFQSGGGSFGGGGGFGGFGGGMGGGGGAGGSW